MSLSRRKLLFGGAGALACVAGGGAALIGVAREHGLLARTRAGVAFGTTVALTFAGEDPAALDGAVTAGFAEIRACERAAGLYRADSALARLNRDGRIDEAGPHLLALTRFALDLARETGGAFDPTVQPLWPLWATATAAGRRPREDERKAAVALVGWRDVEIAGTCITFRRPGMAMTLNGVLQGYAADRVVAAARALGVEHAFVDTGEFAAFGRAPEGRPWRLGGRGETGEPTTLADPFTGFAATSAGAGTAFSQDGRDNHIFDPATGVSPRGLASVTAFASSGMLADGLSTAAMVMGRERAEALAAAYPDVRLRMTVA